jgi:MFS family permease
MAAIRVLHGAAYVVLATAVLSRIVDCIPQEKSGQAFGLLSALTLLPYAVIPPLLGLLTKWTGGFDRVLDLSALAMVPIFPMLTLLDDSPVSISHGAGERRTRRDLVENFKDYRVLLMLFLSLVVWTTFTPVFFFLQGYGSKIGISNPGWFLTLSTFTEIMVRLSAGHIFDKLDKSKLLVFSLMWLTVGYWALIYASWPTAFYAMGLWLGIGWGVAMPVLSAALFDISQPKLRALNTNLGMEMFQGGFFLGPLVGGAILLQWSYTALYLGCAVLTALGMFSALFLGRIGKDNKV